MVVDLSVLVLPAFDDLADLPGEATPWRRAYDLESTIEIDGVPTPLRYSDDGLGVVPTGVGKVAAATTTTALCTSDHLDTEGTLVLSVGAAGGPPELAVGSVVIADRIVDWDDKCRFDPDGSIPLERNPYTEDQGVFELDADLIERARSAVTSVTLESIEAETASTPSVVTGTNLCGDELWHGQTLAEQVSWLVEASDAGTYRATEMEDAGTAGALERFDKLDSYLSIRGITNHDRPTDGQSARESFFDPTFESGFQVGIENAVRLAQAFVDDRLSNGT